MVFFGKSNEEDIIIILPGQSYISTEPLTSEVRDAILLRRSAVGAGMIELEAKAYRKPGFG